MSWNETYISTSKEQAKAAVQACTYVPAGIQVAIAHAIEAMPSNYAIKVHTAGHIDSVNGNCEIEVEAVKLR